MIFSKDIIFNNDFTAWWIPQFTSGSYTDIEQIRSLDSPCNDLDCDGGYVSYPEWEGDFEECEYCFGTERNLFEIKLQSNSLICKEGISCKNGTCIIQNDNGLPIVINQSPCGYTYQNFVVYILPDQIYYIGNDLTPGQGHLFKPDFFENYYLAGGGHPQSSIKLPSHAKKGDYAVKLGIL